MKAVFSRSGGGVAFPIQVEQSEAKGKRFHVRYGLQVWVGLGYADAAKQLGECLFHALACEGMLDNEGAE